MIASVLPLLCLTTQLFALTTSAAAFPRDESHKTTTNATAHVLQYHHLGRGHKIKPGTELRILPVGDSITVGFHSNLDGGDGNGYRLKLKQNLAEDKIVYAGNQKVGPMSDHYFAAWNGKTIQFMSEHIDPSLDQRPNIVLLHAGTNDMNPSTTIAKQGNNPSAAAGRLGKLIDKIVKKCPDATVLVAVIIGTCEPHQELNTVQYQALIPGVVQKRFDEGKHVLAVNFTSFPMKEMRRDCLHPTNNGYKLIGDYWYDFMTQIPKDWIKKPIGPDPDRSKEKEEEENVASRLSFGSLAITFALLFHYLL